MNRRRGERSRGGLVILVVMVVVVLSALVGSSILLSSDVARATAVNDRRTDQSRLAAWSGVQAVVARLHAQRDELLQGESPIIPESWDFPVETPSAPAFSVIGPGALTLAQSENAKLDVNLASAEMLAALPMIDERLAASIVSARPFGSVEELIRVDGVTSELLYGGAPAEAPEGAEGEPATLREALTVFSFDPNVQLGLGEGGQGRLGDRRINLAMDWSDSVRDAVIDRWDESVADFLERLFEQGESLRATSDVVSLMRRLGAAPEDWVEALDAVTTQNSEHVRGLVDLNRASVAVLGAIPGIDQTSARAIVDARERIGLDQRRSIAWPVIEGLLGEDEFVEACDWLTTRSMQWRVRVTGGMSEAGESAGLSDGLATGLGSGLGGEFSSDLGVEPRLRDALTYECVIDVSSRRPRVASLRDVTGLGFALATREPGVSGEDASAPTPEVTEGFDVPGARDEDGPDRVGDPETAPASGAGEGGASGDSHGGRIGRWRTGDGESG